MRDLTEGGQLSASCETNVVSYLVTTTIPSFLPPPPSPLLHLQVKAEAELEQAQRVTQEKKVAVHEELLRKATAKEVGGCGHN